MIRSCRSRRNRLFCYLKPMLVPWSECLPNKVIDNVRFYEQLCRACGLPKAALGADAVSSAIHKYATLDINGACIHIHIYTSIHLYIYTYIRLYILIYACIHIYIYTNIYMCRVGADVTCIDIGALCARSPYKKPACPGLPNQVESLQWQNWVGQLFFPYGVSEGHI